MVYLLNIIVSALWIVTTAYAANAFPPLVKGKKPIDMGKSVNGKRILGNGKTIKGSLSGVLFGFIIGLVQLAMQPWLTSELNASYPLIILPQLTMLSIIIIPIGAIAGDIIGSLIKRRINLRRGSSAPLLDQLDFLIVALMLASLTISINIYTFLFLVIITPIIHWLANLIGYAGGVKSQPW